jgi:hypothetical protein
MPQVRRAITVPASGWGVGIASQLYDTPEFALERVLSILDPAWWHDWAYIYPGGVPCMYQNSYYTDNPAKVDAAAQTWRQVLWGNEPENIYGGDSPADTAQAVTLFKAANPHVKVYGFGSVADAATYHREYQAAAGPALDGFHFHAYMDSDGDWPDIWDYFRRVADGKPIVVTEFGGWSHFTTIDDHKHIMDAVRETLFADTQLEAAAWFAARPLQADWEANSLLDYLGNPTELGRHWLDLR